MPKTSYPGDHCLMNKTFGNILLLDAWWPCATSAAGQLQGLVPIQYFSDRQLLLGLCMDFSQLSKYGTGGSGKDFCSGRLPPLVLELG